MHTAFLVDGAFHLKRLRRLVGSESPPDAARRLHRMCLEHLKREGRPRENLYRIFYYDCPPLLKKAHNPISRRAVDFARSPTALWRLAFFEELKKLRKVALRLGYLGESSATWMPKADKLRQLFSGELAWSALTPNDVFYEVRQKGVDMRIGLDIASMAYKRQVDQIILVAGDSDFVPAAKLARREGIDFVLDPLWAGISADLHEHIDGLCTVIAKPSRAAASPEP